MADHRNDSQDFSLEEILADVRTSREKTSRAGEAAPDDAPPGGKNNSPRAGKAQREEEPEQKPATRRVPLYPEREEEPEQKPATRKVPLYPEREEEPEQKPATRRVPLYPEREEEPITAEDLAELEEDAEQEGYASGGERRRGLRGLFSRSGSGKANSKKKKQAEPSVPDDMPYPGLRLKTRDEYKREYEETMAFDSVPKNNEGSPYAYLFQEGANAAQAEGAELDEQVRRMREERRARIARVMEQAGLDSSEDIFSLYQREEAQRLERESRDAKAAARVLEKAGGPEPEEPVDPDGGEQEESYASTVRRRAAEAARREEERFGWDEPSGKAKSAASRATEPDAPERGEPFPRPKAAGRSQPAPEAEEIAVPRTEPDQDPGDGMMRVNRPAAKRSGRAAPQQTERPASQQTERAASRRTERPVPAAAEAEDETEGIVRVSRPPKAEQPSFRPAPPPVFLSEAEPAEEPAPAAVQAQETPAPVKEPVPAAPSPAREPASAPVREPEEKPHPRVLSGGKHHEHSYRSRAAAPSRVVTMEETPDEIEQALDNEARSYPKPGRLHTAPKQETARAARDPHAQERSAAREAIASLGEPSEETPADEQALPIGEAFSGTFGEEQETASAFREEPVRTARAETEREPAPARRTGRTIPLHPEQSRAPAKDAENGEEPPVKRKPVKKRRSRFSILGTEERDNRPEDEFPADPGEISDYTRPEDAASIQHDLGQKRRALLLRAGVTGLSLLLMLVFGLLSEYNAILPSFIPYYLLTQPYLILELIFLIIAGAFSWPVLYNGVRGLVRLHANSDSAAAIATVAAAVQTVLLLFSTDQLESAAVHLYAPLAVLALFLNTLGKLSMVGRIARNFHFVAAPDRKMAVHLLHDHNTALQMARGCVADTPVIAYQARAGFLRNFLRVSYLPDPIEQNAPVAAPIGIVCSLILCVATLLLSHDALAALTAFTASCCVCTPMMGQLCVNLPLAQASRIVSRHGAMISGYEALDRFSDVNAILIDAKELFPKTNVKISGVRTFGDQRVDEAILEAAALLSETGGTLGEIFDDVIQSRRDLLPKVDSATYEDGKGISGWVSGHRVLIGNRALLEEHHITPPSRDFEKKNLVDDKQILYLASGGQLVAMFPLTYKTDRRRTVELCRLEDNGVSFLVRTCDPNITPELIARCFQLDKGSINVLPTRLGDVYVRAGENTKAPATAWMATKGRPTALMRLLTVCIRQRGNISLAVALQYVAVILGFTLVAFLSCFSGLPKLSTLFLLLYELFWGLAIVILPKLRKP